MNASPFLAAEMQASASEIYLFDAATLAVVDANQAARLNLGRDCETLLALGLHDLAPALDRASGELERELDALVATLVALVEPMVLLLMGGLVLMMVLAILLPIINLNNLVQI